MCDWLLSRSIENLSTTSKKAHRMSILSNLKYINLGGPGGKLLQPGTVAEVLYAFQNLVSLGSYPFMGQVRFKPYTLQIGKKSLICLIEINGPLLGKYLSLPFLPVTPLSPSQTLEGLFELTRRPSRALDSPCALLPELQRYKDIVRTSGVPR